MDSTAIVAGFEPVIAGEKIVLWPEKNWSYVYHSQAAYPLKPLYRSSGKSE
jgi:hypothetical protein